MDNWISVKERLPEQEGYYLVYEKYEDGNGSVNKLRFLKKAFSYSKADTCDCKFRGISCKTKTEFGIKLLDCENCENNISGFIDYDGMDEEFYYVESVTHWMELPEGPKE